MFANSEITKKYHFYSAHRNENLNDKCQFLHGHTYHLEVCLKFQSANLDPESGTFMNFGKIDEIVEPFVASLDHSTLVSKKDFALMELVRENPKIFGKVVTLSETASVEHLCSFVASELSRTEIGPFLCRITIKETETSSVSIPL